MKKKTMRELAEAAIDRTEEAGRDEDGNQNAADLRAARLANEVLLAAADRIDAFEHWLESDIQSTRAVWRPGCDVIKTVADQKEKVLKRFREALNRE